MFQFGLTLYISLHWKPSFYKLGGVSLSDIDLKKVTWKWSCKLTLGNSSRYSWMNSLECSATSSQAFFPKTNCTLWKLNTVQSMLLHHDEDVIVADVTFFITNMTSFIYLFNASIPNLFHGGESIIGAPRKCVQELTNISDRIKMYVGLR